jgi:hypothetical protein
LFVLRYSRMPFKQLIFSILFTVLNVVLFAQTKYTISGYVKDGSSGEVLLGASVFVEEQMKGATTNQYGFYSMTFPQGSYTIIVRYFGFEEYKSKIVLDKDLRINIDLKTEGNIMEEVVVEAQRSDNNTKGTEMGTIELEMSQIKKLPAFFGEIDVLKTIQYLPGVQSGGEGNTGFYVRGGGPDQNLILLDEATVYNASHLFGFFSVFNSDALKDVNLIKGGMPANYGGRLSSVIDISMKDGNSKSYHGEGGIGLIASRLTLEGPIIKDESSFIVSGRRTYIDVLTKPLISDTSAFAGSSYYFYDLNAKANYILSDKDRLYLSGYFGRDVFTFNDADAGFKIKIPWGNATASLRWNHLFSDKLFLNTTAIFSDYNFAFEATQGQFDFKLFSGIRDWNLKTDFTYFPNIRHNIKFGANYIFHTFTPTSVTAKSGETEFDTGDIVKIFANEAAVYALDEYDINENLKINAGLRVSMFQHIGPFKRFVKNNLGETDTTINYERFENIKAYFGFEPRLAMRYLLPDKSSIKVGYTHNYQYIHLSSISSVSLPTDLWFPSTEIVKPQIGTQYSLGYFRNFFDNKYETSVEVYYKNLENLIEYKNAAQPEDNVNDNVDNQLTFGRGYSYGAEFFLKKRYGKFNGWIGYTWSKTERQFDDINRGEWFPAKYDRRHDLSVVLAFDVNERLTLGGVFVFATGSTLTLPVAYYIYENRFITEFGDRNSYRMISYHRADLAVTLNGKTHKEVKNAESGETKKIKKRVQSTWVFSVYNLYNRANPYFIYLTNSGDPLSGNFQTSAFQVSLFPILPSITWNFKF